MKKLILLLFFPLIFFGCASKKFLVYDPSTSEVVSSFFSNGIPIGSYSSEEEFVLFSVDETQLFGKAYLRVWLLYENLTADSYLLEPYNVIKLEAEKDNVFYSEYIAESPSKILSAIDQEEATAMIFKAIGGALESMTVEETTIKSNTGTEYAINDKKEKQKQILQNNQIELQNNANWYNLFRNSISSGVLRKNTVFPNQSVNGYLYFPLGKVHGSNTGDAFAIEIDELNFNLLMVSKNGVKKIKLTPTTIW
jgi:hypothetical protein